MRSTPEVSRCNLWGSAHRAAGLPFSAAWVELAGRCSSQGVGWFGAGGTALFTGLRDRLERELSEAAVASQVSACYGAGGTALFTGLRDRPERELSEAAGGLKCRPDFAQAARRCSRACATAWSAS